MFVNNFEMWKHVYGEEFAEDGSVILNPTTDEEFEQMVKDWEALDQGRVASS